MRTGIMAIVLAYALSATSGGETPLVVDQHAFQVRYSVANGAAVTAIDAWLTPDDGATWSRLPASAIDTGRVDIKVDQDGTYGVYLVLRNAGGASAPDPEAGTTPQTTVLVDTQPPIFQLHGVAPTEVTTTQPAAGTLIFSASLVEEHLPETGLRVFYQTSETEWHDGGTATFTDGRLAWLPPALDRPIRAVRITATDLAGNRSSDTLPLNIAVENDTTEPSPQKPLAPLDVATAAPFTMVPVAPLKIEPVQMPADVLIQPFDGPQSAAPQKTELSHLREVADQFMREGRYGLAADRLRSALALNPANTDVLVDLGSALYRLRQYDDARQQFSAAYELMPTHTGALNGLALVAATEKRYPEARRYLTQLQELMPSSAMVWLRSGDIEQKLGNTTPAVEYWRRALALPDADEEVRQMVQRRLDYFGRRVPSVEQREPDGESEQTEQRSATPHRSFWGG